MHMLGLFVIVLFGASCVVAFFSGLWVLAFSIRMLFEFSDRDDAFSRRTLWNPANVIFSPSLLSERGVRSRKLVIRGLVSFLIALLVAACMGGIVALTS